MQTESPETDSVSSLAAYGTRTRMIETINWNGRVYLKQTSLLALSGFLLQLQSLFQELSFNCAHFIQLIVIGCGFGRTRGRSVAAT